MLRLTTVTYAYVCEFIFLLLLNSHCSDALITQTNCMTRFRLKYDFNCALRLPALRLLGLMCPSNIHTYICMYVGMCWYPPATWLYFAAVLPYCRFGAFDLFIGICSRFYFSTFCFCIFLLIFCCFPFVPLVVIVIDRIVVVVIVMSAFLAAHVDIVMVMC